MPNLPIDPVFLDLIAQIILPYAEDKKINLPENFAENLAQYLAEMVRWSAARNLTSITAPEAVVKLHALDSLSIAPFIDPNQNLADIGTGAGFPGMVLGLIFPDLKIHLIDSNQKKILFLQHIVRNLGLKNIEVKHSRAEQLAPKQFAQITTRAYASLLDNLTSSVHSLAEGGRFLAMKGKIPHDEILAVRNSKLFAAWQIETEVLDVPAVNAERCLVTMCAP